MRRIAGRPWLVAAGAVAFSLGALGLDSLSGEPAPEPPESFEAPGATLETLHLRGAPIKGGLTEGPAAAPDGSIYFSDIPQGPDRGMILRFDPATGKTSVFADDSRKANGLAFDSQGRLISCEGADGGGRAIARWDIKTGQRTVLVDRHRGKRFNSPNDLCLDAADRIYFTDPRYVGDEPLELKHRAVYRFDPASNELVEVTHDVSMPNGIAVSLDGRTLYVADTDQGQEATDSASARPRVMRIYAFPLNEQGVVAGERRILFEFGNRMGCDGMTLDVDGNLYLATRDPAWPSILVLTPGGQELTRISTYIERERVKQSTARAASLPSNVEFGRGDDANMLYITIDTGLYRIRLTRRGYR
ncbi:MAG: SMP-30/gluconolactonase/LRE family protein [Pirellulales bacterium]|nr:SMP-30/gluconolactonase/LRE family protein [Pirellulales bacterium]